MSERSANDLYPITVVPLVGKMICERDIPLAVRRTTLKGVAKTYWDENGYYRPRDVYRALKKELAREKT